MSYKRFIATNSYLIVTGVLVLFETLYILKGQWTGDFFEHSAVVNELSKNLIYPNNPIIKSDIPHAFFSPYSVLVACFSKITSLNSIDSLAYFAFFNLFLFLYSFYYFSKCVFKKNYLLISSVALILILIFWGKSPFNWSGFIHVFGLHYVLPYPSTFALSLSLLSLGIVSKNNNRNNLIVILLCSIVLISHPTTAITLFIGIITLTFSFNNYSIKQCFIKSLILIVPSIILSLFWPYFNILDLFIGNSNNIDFHEQSLLMYSDIIKKNWPILFIIPSFIYSNKDSTVMFFILTIGLLLLIYVGGYLFSFYGVSRVISSIMLFSHLLIAYTTIVIISEPKLINKVYLSFLFVAIIISLSLNFMNLGRVAYGVFKTKNISYYTDYTFLKSVIKPNNIILSDSDSNWFIPSYNGKIIASDHPLYWVNDYKERRDAINSFFMKEEKDSSRLLTLIKYQPTYILINYNNVDITSSTYQWLQTIGETIYIKNKLELIKIRQQ
jgi:hypothetical protein